MFFFISLKCIKGLVLFQELKGKFSLSLPNVPENLKIVNKKIKCPNQDWKYGTTCNNVGLNDKVSYLNFTLVQIKIKIKDVITKIFCSKLKSYVGVYDATFNTK